MLHPRENKSSFAWISPLLWNDRSAVFAYGFAAILSVLYILYLYPLDFLLGHGQFFETSDAAQHVSGWWFYRHDAWRFPLLLTNRLNHPDGVTIAFTDSIPLAALLLKAIVPWLPTHFHYIGLWHGIVFFTQALAATFLIRALGVRHAFAVFIVVAFALAWPALMWRLAHTALMTHALILVALALYFLGRHGKWNSNACTLGFIVLNVTGLTIHPYFLAFCYPLFLAFLADQALAGEGWRPQLPRFVISVMAICIVGAVLGYFGRSTAAGGFEIFSMNLASPFCGGRFLTCLIDGSGGQYEGFNYFGIGVLILLPFAIAGKWSSLKQLPKHYPALLLILVLFTIYALSTKIYLTTHQVLSYPLPSMFNKITGTFRASGRFFWPVGYAILFGCMFALLKRPSWRSVGLFAIVLPLQWVDVHWLQERIITEASKPATNDLAPWEETMAGVDKIHVFPAFGCPDSHNADTYLFFQRLAAYYGKLIDTGYIARPNVNCSDNMHAFNLDFKERHLYVMPADYLVNGSFTIPVGFANALRRGECTKRETAIICQIHTARDQWKQAGLQVEAVTASD